ncbi:MAG: efflux RND transporter permease subunit [Leptospira sp.]|nr:efflux RND transporter permease subunit [Leptospira sp.]
MILQLCRLILNRRVATFMLFVGLSLFGVLSYLELPLSLLPNIEFPKLSIVTLYENASPEEVESMVSKPISQLLGTIHGVDRVESNTKEGYSFVTLKFKQGTSMSYAILEVREKLDLLRDTLPHDTSKPLITKFDPSKKAFMEIVYSMKGDRDEQTLRSFVNDSIKLHFERIDGIALVEVNGGFEKEILIEVDPKRLSSYNIQISELSQLIKMNNKNYPAGQLPFGKKDLPVRLIGEFGSIESLKEMIIQSNENGAYTRLSDIATISERFKERMGFSKFNGKEAVILSLYLEPGKNTVLLAKEVKDTVTKLNDIYLTQVVGEVCYDDSIFIKETIHGLYFNLILGAVLAFLTLLMILKNYQSPLILLFALPLTLFPSFFIFRCLGIGLNMMSLGGLALGIGMLFDASNVVISAIEKNLRSFSKLDEAIASGVNEVFNSIFAAAATTVIVFLPIGFIESSLGLIFREMAISIVILIVCSFFTAIAFIPLAASYLYQFRSDSDLRFYLFRVYNEEKLIHYYLKLLSYILEKRKIFFTVIFIVLLVSISLFYFIKKEYIPRVDSGEIVLNVTLPIGSSLENTSRYIDSLESILLSNINTKAIFTKIGCEEENIRMNPKAMTDTNQAEIKLILADDRDISSDELIESLENSFPKKNGIGLHFEKKENVLGELLSDSGDKIVYHVLGENLNELNSFASQFRSRLINIPKIQWIHLGNDTVKTEFQIHFDQIKMAKFGFTNANVASFLKIALKGVNSSEYQNGNSSLRIRLGMLDDSVNKIEKIRQMTLLSPSHHLVSLGQFLNFSSKETQAEILRIGNRRVNEIEIGIKGDKSEMKTSIDSIIEELNDSTNLNIIEAGEKEQLHKSLKDIVLSLLLALILIFMLLSGQFESYKTSFMMLVSIPLVLIGTFPALLITGKSLNVSSFMGFILLMGVVVDNASLFFEYFQHNLKEYLDPKVALFESSQTVLRPILMNNITTILGMMPIALSLTKGSEFQAPLGIVVISGLFTSFLLSLFVLPILFYTIEKQKLVRDVS